MPSILLRRTGQTRPAGRLRIRPYWYGRGLVVVVAGGEDRNLVNGALLTSTGSHEASALGIADKFVSGSSQYLDAGALPASSALTFGAVYISGAANVFAASSRTTSSAQGVEILLGSGGTAGFDVVRVQSSTASVNVGSSGLNDGRFHHLTGAWTSGGGIIPCVDGVRLSASSTLGGSVTHSQNLYMARRGSTYWSGVMALLYHATQAWTTEEIVAVQRNVWGEFFVPDRTRIYFEASGGSPTPVAFSGTVPTLNGLVGTPFSVDLASYFSGSFTPFTFALHAGTLPGWATLSGSVISGTPSGAATTSGLVVRATDTATNFADTNSFAIAITSNAAPTFPGSISNISATQGTAITPVDVTGEFSDPGDTLTYSKTGTWPAGLGVSSVGIISGTPTVNGTFSAVKVRATDTASQTVDSNAFTVTIAAGNSAPVFTGPNQSNITITVGVAMTPVDVSGLFTDVGDTLTFSAVGSWPAGVTVSSAGVISGTPTASGTYSALQVRATDTASQTAVTNAFSIIVSSAAGSITLLPLKNLSGSLLTSKTINVTIVDASTGAYVTSVIGLVSDATTAVVTVSSASIVSGRDYVVFTSDPGGALGSACGARIYTAS